MRSTLTHEYGHVHWHAPLYEGYCDHDERHNCARGKVLPQSGERNSREWQAGYVSGVLLMPKSRVDLHVTAFRERAVEGLLDSESVEGRVLIKRTGDLFNVSEKAARVRFGQLGHLGS